MRLPPSRWSAEMGFLRSFVRSTQKAVKQGQKAAATRERSVATAARSQAAEERAREAAAALDAARLLSPYFHNSWEPPGSRVSTLEPWPTPPDGDDAALERWERKVSAIDRRLGLWTGDYEAKIGREAVNELPNWRRGEVPASPDRIGQVDFPV